MTNMRRAAKCEEAFDTIEAEVRNLQHERYWADSEEATEKAHNKLKKEIIMLYVAAKVIGGKTEACAEEIIQIICDGRPDFWIYEVLDMLEELYSEAYRAIMYEICF